VAQISLTEGGNIKRNTGQWAEMGDRVDREWSVHSVDHDSGQCQHRQWSVNWGWCMDTCKLTA